MKKFLFAAMYCFVAITAQAKEITYNVYYNEITNTRGELYQYAERYIGTKDVIMADSHSYELDKIKLITADANNGATSSTSQSEAQDIEPVKKQLPLSEETLLATNLAKKAESVAKQIYRIRETRLNILSGDVEHIPSDGEAMKLVLDELNRQEEALTSMFVGKTQVKSHRQSVSINISDTDKAIQKPLFKFSSEEGMLDITAQQGDPITISVIRTSVQVLAEKQPRKGEPIYEEQIVSSKTLITYLNKTIYAQTSNL